MERKIFCQSLEKVRAKLQQSKTQQDTNQLLSHVFGLPNRASFRQFKNR